MRKLKNNEIEFVFLHISQSYRALLNSPYTYVVRNIALHRCSCTSKTMNVFMLRNVYICHFHNHWCLTFTKLICNLCLFSVIMFVISVIQFARFVKFLRRGRDSSFFSGKNWIFLKNHLAKSSTKLIWILQEFRINFSIVLLCQHDFLKNYNVFLNFLNPLRIQIEIGIVDGFA